MVPERLISRHHGFFGDGIFGFGVNPSRITFQGAAQYPRDVATTTVAAVG
jgi:hypothetical protein